MGTLPHGVEQVDNNNPIIMTEMRKWMTMLALLIGMVASAQNAETLYREGKALYDKKDYAKAIVKLRPAAEKGHKKAQYRMGRCYEKGNGVAKDEKQAFKWYSKSAEQGYAKAQYQVGKCYKEGEGTVKDRKKAIHYFTLAAKQDNADAQYQLGKAYLKGKDVPADEAKAKSLLKKAISDEKDGKDILKKIRDDAANDDEDAKKILALLKK